MVLRMGRSEDSEAKRSEPKRQVFSSSEQSVRNCDLMQMVAEISAYEDFVDEGNYNVVHAIAVVFSLQVQK